MFILRPLTLLREDGDPKDRAQFFEPRVLSMQNSGFDAPKVKGVSDEAFHGELHALHAGASNGIRRGFFSVPAKPCQTRSCSSLLDNSCIRTPSLLQSLHEYKIPEKYPKDIQARP